MSNGYDFTTGQYPYPLSRVPFDGGDFCKPFITGNPANINPGVDNWYIICATPDEMNMIQSSIEVGSVIAYPNDYNEVMQIFDQCLEFPNSFEGAPCMDLCQLIIDCINNTPELQQAIAEYSNSYYPDIDQPEIASILSSNFVPASPTCNNDYLFGMTTGLTDLLNQLCEDLLEILQNAPSLAARIGDIIEAIPGIGEAPADDLLQFTEALTEDIAQAYLAAYDSQIRDDIRCNLFCIGQQECSLTIEQARDYFQSKLTASVSNTDFLVVLNDIIANNWLGEQSIYVMNWLIMDTIIFGGEFLGINHNRLLTQIAALFNDPDPDWAIICECENIYYLEVDFTATEGGFSALSGNKAIWVSGQGWREVDDSGISTDYVTWTFPETIHLLSASVIFGKTPATSTGFREISIYDDGVRQQQVQVSGQEYPYPTTYTYDRDTTLCTRLLYQIASSPQNCDINITGGRITIKAESIPAFLTSAGWTEYTP